MSEIQAGQVLSLRIRFNNRGLIAIRNHPYLVVGVDKELGKIEIAQLDSLEGKEYKATSFNNKVIYCDNPRETVIDKDSYIQLDNSIIIDDSPKLRNSRRQLDTLSSEKLADVIQAYSTYHATHEIIPDKIVYMPVDELTSYNPSLAI